MTPVLRLTIIVGIEIDVVQNHSVRRGQVDSLPTGPSCQQKDEDLRVVVELVNQILPEKPQFKVDKFIARDFSKFRTEPNYTYEFQPA